MNITRIRETCIYVSDLERTKTFYHVLLGLPLISMAEGRHVFFEAGESVLLCFIAEKTKMETDLPPHGATGSIHFAFEVKRSSYDATLENLRNKGIHIIHEHSWKEGLRSFYFHDPDKHLLEVIEEGLWERK